MDTLNTQCSFCGSRRGAVNWMIGCANELFICNVCVDLAGTTTETGEASNDRITLRRDPDLRSKTERLARLQEELSRLLDEIKGLGELCRFCGYEFSTLVRPAGSDVTICDECLEECHVIARQEGLEGSG